MFRGFVKDTIDIFYRCGVKLYNDIILINRYGSTFLRAGGMFKHRKLVGLHQYVLVFYKGDAKRISKIYTDKHRKKGNSIRYAGMEDII